MNAILGFHSEYAWLSNFYLIVVKLDGHKYPSVENAYQAAKTIDLLQREPFRFISPSNAKQSGRFLTIREDWERVKVQIMRELLIQKFSNVKLRAKLRATGNAYLEETNTWGDRFWGVYDGFGFNKLGNLLMEIRQEDE